MKIVAEENLAAMPKFILDVKDGVVLFLNEHTRLADGWYWRCDASPFFGPFASIDDAGEAAAIASDAVRNPHASISGHRSQRPSKK